MKTPDALLDEGAALLDRDGWTQYTLEDDQGRRCTLGAIYSGAVQSIGAMAMYPLPGAVEAAITALAEVVGAPYRLGRFDNADGQLLIARWNNQRGRTKDEVTTAMRAVAAQLRAEREAAKAIDRAAREPETCE
jgi:hypothetical protein